MGCKHKRCNKCDKHHHCRCKRRSKGCPIDTLNKGRYLTKEEIQEILNNNLQQQTIEKSVMVNKNDTIKDKAIERLQKLINKGKHGLNFIPRELTQTTSKEVNSYSVEDEEVFDKFVGFWLLDSLNAYQNCTLLEFFRDNGQHKVRYYTGTQNNIREITAADVPFGSKGWTILNPASPLATDTDDTNNVEVIGVNSLRIFNVATSVATALGPDELRSTIRIQDNDENVAWAIFWVLFSGIGDGSEYGLNEPLQKYIRLEEEPSIERRDVPQPQNNNPVNLFNFVYDQMVLGGQCQKAVVQQDVNYIGFDAMTDLRDTIRDIGVIRTAKSSISFRGNGYIGVWTTEPSQFAPTTTIYTEEPHKFTGASKVTVTGFTGVYSMINGEHNVVNITLNSAVEPYQENGWINPTSLEYSVYLLLDTSSIDEKYDPTVHGRGTLTAQHGPVTVNTEYRDLVAAMTDFIFNSFGSCTHGRISPWLNPEGIPYETFDELNAGIAAGAELNYFRSRTFGANGSSALYHNPFANSFVQLPFPIFNINDSFGLGRVGYNEINPLFDIDVDLNNYIDKCRKYSLYWTVTGPILEDQPITDRLLNFGYPSNGSRFVYTTSKYLETPPDLVDEFGVGVHPWLLPWSVPGFDLIGTYFDLQFGIIDKCLTKHKTVAYIRIKAEFPVDALQGNLSVAYSLTFGRNDLGSTYGTPFMEAMAAILKRLNKHKPDKYILDIRGNIGGIAMGDKSYGQFFGGNRMAILEGNFFPGDGTQDPTAFLNSGIQTGFNGVQSNAEAYNLINTDLMAEKFPKSIVRGSSCKPIDVVILTDTNAGSGGDLFPHMFTGGNPNDTVHDLGYNVTSRVIGDIDGRLKGGFLPDNTLPVNSDNPLVYDINGPLTPVSIVMENGVFYKINNEFINNPRPRVQPDILLPTWYDTTQWQDIGVAPVKLPYPLGKLKHLPKFDNNKTWRDVKLEYAIKK